MEILNKINQEIDKVLKTLSELRHEPNKKVYKKEHAKNTKYLYFLYDCKKILSLFSKYQIIKSLENSEATERKILKSISEIYPQPTNKEKRAIFKKLLPESDAQKKRLLYIINLFENDHCNLH